jgi:hypothetical protein
MSSVRNAIKNGLLRISELEYPMLIAVQHFPSWDKAAFAADNSLSAVPTKSEVRKAIRDALTHLTLGVMLVDGQLGGNPTVSSVTPIYKRIERNISGMLPSKLPIEQRDGILARAYVRALKDFKRSNTKLSKFLEKNEQYLKMPKKQAVKPKKKSSSRKKVSTKQNSVDVKKKAVIQQMIKDGDVRKLSRSPRKASDFVDLYLSSASLSAAKAQTKETKSKARSNRRKFNSMLKKK